VNQADTSLAPCEYADGVGCYCVGNRSAAQGGIVGDSGLWKCYGPPKNGACPELLPNLGEGCAVNGQNCVYGQVTQQCFSPYARVVCESGAWQDAGGDCAE
jgi:hypothetical protein